VEGNNTNSDYWLMENLPNSSFSEPSGVSVDHYNRYEEDISLLKNAGLNAYRFSLEWARIEPNEGQFDEAEIEHYRKVLTYCRDNGIEPIVTLHHFSSPKWLISKGGWEWEGLAAAFARYCAYVAEKLGGLLKYVCTINEANMGLQIADISKSMMLRMGITPQVGMNFEDMVASYMPTDRLQQKRDIAAAFGIDNPNGVHDFLSFRSEEGDELTVQAHIAARQEMKKLCPHLTIGLTLSLYDLQPQDGGEELANSEWARHFGHYLPALRDDDFIGVQNYTRKKINGQGDMGNPEGVETTQMGYEFYPQAIANVVRRAAEELPGKEIIITENGIAVSDDSCRVEFIKQALEGIAVCVADRIPVRGYMYWSLLDNFEWQEGYKKTFGLIAVDRETQKREPKQSLYELGAIVKGAKE
jgi:beta-glucosidase